MVVVNSSRYGSRYVGESLLFVHVGHPSKRLRLSTPGQNKEEESVLVNVRHTWRPMGAGI